MSFSLLQLHHAVTHLRLIHGIPDSRWKEMGALFISVMRKPSFLGSSDTVYSKEDATIATKEFSGYLVLHYDHGDREKPKAEKRQ